MCDNFATWRNVLIKWVNCLGLQDTPIQKISELGDGKFFHSLLNVISHKQKHGISTDVADKAVTEFLKYEYPFYVRESESCEMEDLEIMYVTSLLMLHCILESKNKNIMEHMYKLDDETQVYIKNFFETIMQYGNNITRNVVKHAISECGNNKSLKETRKKHSTESPLISFSTPKCPPIMDVVQSPLAQKLKQLSEQRAVIERLNNELESEQAEKVLLQEELQQERDKTKKLTKQLIDRNDEMKKLREEWLYGDSESSQKAQCSNSCQEALLKKQIKDLETYISSLHGDIDILHKKQDLLQQRVFKAEHQYQMWYAESQQSEALCEKLKHDAVEKEHELAHTKELCSELQRQVQEMKQVHNISVEEDPYIMSPGCRTPENLGQAVIDLRLQEQQEENKIITEQLKKMIIEEEAMKKQICDLHIRSENVEHEAAALKATNLELRGKVDEMEDLQHELEECRVEQGLLYEELDVLNAELVSVRGENMQILQSNDMLRNELSNAEKMCHDIAQKYKDLTFRIEILNSENGKLLKDVEQLETLKSVMAVNERTLAAERSLNAELKAEKEAFGDLYRTLKDNFQKLKGDNESLNKVIGTMKNQTSNLHKYNLELNEKVQKYEMSYLKCEGKSRKLRRMREERQAEFNRLFNSETILRQKMSEFQRSLKDISYKFETIVLGTAASCSELKVIDCQRTELEELLTLMCIECEEILHSILTWTYRSFQETEQNVENQYLGISVHLGANKPPDTVLNLVRASESDVTKDTGGVNMRTWQQQELDDIQLQISTLISGIEVALKKCTSVDTQCNHILEIYNTNTEHNNIFCDRGVLCNVRGLNLVDRTNLIKHIVTKLQGSEKNDTELEVVEDGWNPEDYLEMDSGTKSAFLTCEEKEHKKKDSDHSVILKMRLKLEQKLAQTTREVEFLNAQNKSLQLMLDKQD